MVYAWDMSVQVAVRLEEADLRLLDQMVSAGEAGNRSAALRGLIERKRREQRYQAEAELMSRLVATGESVYPEVGDFVAGQDLAGLG